MDRGAWPATVHKGHKELDTTEVTEHACSTHSSVKGVKVAVLFC